MYFSLHRYDNGDFYPGAEDADFDYVGDGNGTGYNINVAWNGNSMGDSEYLLAFCHILLPVAFEVSGTLYIVTLGTQPVSCYTEVVCLYSGTFI